MDNVVVTGGFGFVGNRLTQELLKHKKKVTIIDDLSSPSPAVANFVEHLAMNGANNIIPTKAGEISFFKADMRDQNQIIKIFGQEQFDTCIHLAAKISVSESITNPRETVTTNIDGTLNAIDACALTKVKNFVFASTGAVYGEPTTLPINEDHVLNPMSIYAATKIAAESLLAAYVNSKKLRSGISLRFFNIYGNGQNPQYAGIIANFTNRISHGLAPVIYGNGEQSRDFIYVNDAVRAIMLAASFGSESSEYNVFNIASGIPITINELAYMMTDIFKLNLKPNYLSERVGDVKHASVDISKAQEILGFVPKTNLRANLIEMLRHSDLLQTETTDNLPKEQSTKVSTIHSQ